MVSTLQHSYHFKVAQTVVPTPRNTPTSLLNNNGSSGGYRVRNANNKVRKHLPRANRAVPTHVNVYTVKYQYDIYTSPVIRISTVVK